MDAMYVKTSHSPFVRRRSNVENCEMEPHCNVCTPRKAIRVALPTVCWICPPVPYRWTLFALEIVHPRPPTRTNRMLAAEVQLLFHRTECDRRFPKTVSSPQYALASWFYDAAALPVVSIDLKNTLCVNHVNHSILDCLTLSIESARFRQIKLNCFTIDAESQFGSSRAN